MRYRLAFTRKKSPQIWRVRVRTLAPSFVCVCGAAQRNRTKRGVLAGVVVLREFWDTTLALDMLVHVIHIYTHTHTLLAHVHNTPHVSTIRVRTLS